MKTYFVIIFALMTINLAGQPMIVAHRGASYLAPENTVASANLAWELGTDAVEVDIHLSEDNRVMVIHDKTTERTSVGNRILKVEDVPSELLRDLDVGAWKAGQFEGEKIPFLSEIIETVPENKILVVEIKCGSEVLPHLKRVVEESGKQDQIVFISFGWNTILDTKIEFPGNKCYWLSDVKTGLKTKMKQAAEAGLEGVNLSHNIIDEEVIQLGNELNLEILTWTVDDPAEAKRLIDLGVSAITTNRPNWLAEQVGML